MVRPNIVLVIVLTALVGLLGVSVAAAKGFKTPEDAVTAYLEGVAAHDFDKILAATAIEEMSAGFDFVAYIDRLRALTIFAPAPTTDPMFVDINRATYTAQIGRQVQFLTYGLLNASDLNQGRSVMMDGAAATGFADELDLERLAGLTVSRIAAPAAAAMNSEISRANFATQARTQGADEQVERVALVSFEGATYLIGFTLLRYGQEWGISNQISAFAGTDVLGTPQPITPEAFEEGLR